MPSSVKKVLKKTQNSSSESVSKFNGMYALLRDEATEKLHVVPHKELISAKNLAKLNTGDIVCHGKGDKRFRAKIVLLGNEDQCQQSLRIIERMGTVSSQIEISNNKTITNKINHNEEQVNEEDEVVEVEGESEEEEESEEAPEPTEENQADFDDQMEKENINPEQNELPSRQSVSSLEQSSNSLEESSGTLKRKTIPETEANCNLPCKKRSKNTGSVSMRDHAKLVTQLAAADEQNQLYQATWMPRPVDKATIQYFINIGKVLSNGGDNAPDSDSMMDPGDLLDRICLILNMTEDQLNANRGKTILSTARQIIGAKYPDPSTVFSNVKQEHIQAVIDFAWLVHPTEKKANDAAKLRHAMGNVFAARKFMRKLKLANPS